ncbi:MAG: carbohydrate ABC transporter permease [Propionibacterium sp.]|nr:carbohydrate ABC transporter permease [Propionibacterium sp.]
MPDASSHRPAHRRARHPRGARGEEFAGSRGSFVALHAVGLVVTALYLLPMLYILTVALTPRGESTTTLPTRLDFGNFAAALQSADFLRFFGNSLLVTLVATLSQVVLSCMAGYALAKAPLRGRGWILMLLIGLLVLPPEIIMVPLFVILTHLPLVNGNNILGSGGQGLLNNYLSLMMPHLAAALSIFLMRQFYVDLPDELGQAARVDGASEWRIFSQVYTPLTLPAVTVVAVLAFQSAWNDFLWPLIMVRSSGMRTLQLGVTVFYQENSTQWNLLMCIVLLISLPVVLIFLFSQRFFTSGIAAGSVKG